MARDYAKRRTSKRKTKSSKKTHKGRWFWFIVILLLLGFAAFLLMLTRAPNQAELEALAPRPPITSAKKPAETKEMPKFEFYELLPEKQIAPPKAPEKPAPAPVAPTTQNFWVQIAAFPNFADADSMKAELAMLGFPAVIESVNIDGQTWYRVRSGPFATKQEAEAAQIQFQEAEISTQVVPG